MKKLLTILLLIVATLNLGGYGVFMACLENYALEKFEQQLDANRFTGQQLLTIKMPVTMLPYYTNSQQYQRQDGEIEIKGVVYNYVKKRIYQDTLEIICVANNYATGLRTARNDFLKLCNDMQNASKSKKPVTALKFFSPGNCKEKRSLAYQVFYNNCKPTIQPYELLPAFYAAVIEDPPEAC